MRRLPSANHVGAARTAAESKAVYAPLIEITGLNAITRPRLHKLRGVFITYNDLQGVTSQRTVRPLG